MGQRHFLTVTSDVERLGEVAEFVENVTAQCGMNDDQKYDVQMAVDEAVTNVIEHAYRGRADGAIEIACECRGKEFVITIQDFGEPFNPQHVKLPKTHAPLSKRNIGGLGLFFMKKMMDKVEFEFSVGQGNRLTMIKKVKK